MSEEAFLNRQLNVLIFPGGSEIGLEIHKSLSLCKDIHIFSAGMDVSNHAPFVFSRHFTLPSIYDPEWLHKLNQIIDDMNIDYIFPAYDDVLLALSENSCQINAKVVSSPHKTCHVTRSKLLTYDYFKNTVPVPIIYNSIDEVVNYPVFIKPDHGQGSQNSFLVNSKKGYSSFSNINYIMSEFLPGKEYTIDCFSDRCDGLLFCRGRERIRLKSGISMHCRSASNPVFTEYAKAISSKLPFHGAWFFQLKEDLNNNLKLLEIAPRIAGTMAYHRVLGVNFALLSLYEQERIPIIIMINNISLEIDRSLVNRYKSSLSYDVVYVDIDDTLIIKGNLNVKLVYLLYQCVAKKIKVVLLTKSKHDVTQLLKMFRISELFDEVIHLSPDDNKYSVINPHRSIFIDDSFSERKAVDENRRVSTFDCSMLEMLYDDKC
jgi:hypothetical protein